MVRECPVCSVADETTPHCLFTCPLAMWLWHRFGFVGVQPPNSIPAEVMEWLRHLVENNGTVVPVILCCLWCTRNKKIFEGEQQDRVVLAGRVAAMNQVINKAFGGLTSGTSTTRIPRHVSWLGCPAEDCFALNVDGSAKRTPTKSGI